MLTIEQLYDLNHTLAADYLRQFTYPWEALVGIKAEILRIGAALDPAEYTEISEHVWVHKPRRLRRRRIWVRPASSARGRKCGIARSSAAVRW